MDNHEEAIASFETASRIEPLKSEIHFPEGIVFGRIRYA